MTERLTVGVAARLSRYLQVLTQARKMGKERISSQEIAEYTNINATQIRRDLSAFGRFGKRGVGYRTDALLEEIRQILRTQGQHNIALVGAGRLGSAIASSPIFAEHGITVAAVLDNDPPALGFHREISCTQGGTTDELLEACLPGASVEVAQDLDGVVCLDPTSNPCGNGTVGAAETCDPPGSEILDTSGGPTGIFCRGDCTFCGDGIIQPAVEGCEPAGTAACSTSVA